MSGASSMQGATLVQDSGEGGRGFRVFLHLSGEDASMRGQIVPEFFTRSGERRELPAALMEAIRAVTSAVNTLNCRKTVFAKAAEIIT